MHIHEVSAVVDEVPAEYKDEGGVELIGGAAVEGNGDKPKPKWRMRGPNLKLSDETKAEVIRLVNEEKKSAKSVARQMGLPPTSCYRLAGQARGDEKHMPRAKKEKIIVEGNDTAEPKPPRKKRAKKRATDEEEEEEERDHHDEYDNDHISYDDDGVTIETSLSKAGRPRQFKKYRDDF